jgi:hypothetical protein
MNTDLDTEYTAPQAAPLGTPPGDALAAAVRAYLAAHAACDRLLRGTLTDTDADPAGLALTDDSAWDRISQARDALRTALAAYEARG